VRASSPLAQRETPVLLSTGLSKLNSEQQVGCRRDLGEPDISDGSRKIHRTSLTAPQE
jgi:hypothetical protein